MTLFKNFKMHIKYNKYSTHRRENKQEQSYTNSYLFLKMEYGHLE